MADEKDDLLADIRSAMEQNNGEGAGGNREPSGDAAPPARDEGQPPSRDRDESGRFAPKAKEEGEGEKRPTLTLKEPKEKPAAEPGATETRTGDEPKAAAAKPVDQQQKQKADPPPPIEWKGAAKINWGHLPAPIRETLTETWQSIQAERAEMAPFKELLDVNREFLVNQAGSLPAALTQLMQFARMSVDKPRELIQHIARTTGIDLSEFGGQPQQQQMQAGTQLAQPDIASLIEQAVQAKLQPQLEQQAQREQQQLNQTVEAFRADPKHPYFEDVRQEMAALLKAGVATDLQDAYDRATWANPTIRAQLQESAIEEAKRNHAAEAEKARTASRASLRGSPLPGGATSPAAGNQTSTVHDDVRAAMAELSGA